MSVSLSADAAHSLPAGPSRKPGPDTTPVTRGTITQTAGESTRRFRVRSSRPMSRDVPAEVSAELTLPASPGVPARTRASDTGTRPGSAGRRSRKQARDRTRADERPGVAGRVTPEVTREVNPGVTPGLIGGGGLEA